MTYKRREILRAAAAAAAVIIIAAFVLFRNSGELHKYSSMHMGTIINISIIDSTSAADEGAEAVFGEMARIEKLMSPYQKESDIYRINSSAPGGCAAVTGETLELIKRSAQICGETRGAFDISFASLSGLWNFKREKFIPPADAAVKNRVGLVDCTKIIIDSEKGCVSLKSPEMQIGVGGIAKGYAVARAVDMLRSRGITSAIVEAGGDLQVIGTNRGKMWTAGLRHPREDGLLLSVKLKDSESVVTSGDYERYAYYRGRRYHHIIDPRTGFPAEGMISVSVICRDPVEGDAWSTGLFVMGTGAAREILKGRDDMSVIMIDSNMNISASKALMSRITFFGDFEIDWF